MHGCLIPPSNQTSVPLLRKVASKKESMEVWKLLSAVRGGTRWKANCANDLQNYDFGTLVASLQRLFESTFMTAGHATLVRALRIQARKLRTAFSVPHDCIELRIDYYKSPYRR